MFEEVGITENEIFRNVIIDATNTCIFNIMLTFFIFRSKNFYIFQILKNQELNFFELNKTLNKHLNKRDFIYVWLVGWGVTDLIGSSHT